MKYFTVTYVSQKTLHPDGYKTFTSFVAADTKHAAKLKALEVLSQEDPACCMMYKVPRLDEISEEEYLRNTASPVEVVDEPDTLATDQYCALLAIFGEQDEYDDDERRDADDLLACPDDEPDVYAEYLSLRRLVAETLDGTPVSLSLSEIQALAVQLYNGEWVGKSEIHNSLNSEDETNLSTEVVDNQPHIPEEVAEGETVREVSSEVNISSVTDARSPELSSDERREYPHSHESLELEISCALWPGDVDASAVPREILEWAKKKISRREEDLIGWVCALRKVPDIFSYSRAFIFDVIREVDNRDIYLDAAAIDAHVASFITQYRALYTSQTDDDVQESNDVNTLNSDLASRDCGDDFVDANKLNSEITLTDSSARTFLADYFPVNGVTEFDEERPIANGAANAVEILNRQLSAIPNGGSLVIVDLSNDLYHACDGYSSTQLRMVQRGGTAALAWYKSAPRDESKSGALSLGTAVHTAILEPARFDEDFVCAPDVNLRTSDGKAELAAFEEQCEADGLTPMKSDDYRKVCLMRDSALAQPVIAALLQRGVAELSVFYRTEQGVLFKVRPDWFGELCGVPFVMDVKTTDDVQDFGKSVEKYGYHVQAAFYSLVMNKVFGVEADFAFCVVGKSLECGRYPVSLGLLEDADFDEGMLQVRETITQLEVCERDGFSADMGIISRPWWARMADQRRRATQEASA